MAAPDRLSQSRGHVRMILDTRLTTGALVVLGILAAGACRPAEVGEGKRPAPSGQPGPSSGPEAVAWVPTAAPSSSSQPGATSPPPSASRPDEPSAAPIATPS